MSSAQPLLALILRRRAVRTLQPAFMGGMCLLASLLPLHAAEHVILRNGFELTCDHRGVIPGEGDPGTAAFASSVGSSADAHGTTKVRLYLDPGGANYLDVAPTDIVSSEKVADVPLPASAIQTASIAKPSLEAHADLSPAELSQILATAGTEHDLDVDLLASVVQAESGSHTRAVSRAGAQGLMQLMPATAAELGVRDSFAPEANVHGGTAYLDSLLKRYHDNLAFALAAYNAGPAAVDRFHGVPPYRETRAYVARIIHEFNRRYAARQVTAGLAISR